MKKLIQGTLLLLSVMFIVLAAYLWLTFASPFTYHPSGELPEIDNNTSYSVFVYGTLKKPWVRWLVMGRAGKGKPATLPGYQKEALDIKPALGEVTEGQIITVSGTELRALDRYERLGVRYERIQLTSENGESVWVYKLISPSISERSNQLTK